MVRMMYVSVQFCIILSSVGHAEGWLYMGVEGECDL